jgi:hypothetical protein
MGIVDRRAAQALIEGSKYTNKNTKVDENTLYLHGNPIIEVRDDGVYIQTAGWNTLTTKRRLNALPNVNVYNKRGVLHLNGVPWDGNWIKVDTDLL